MDIATHIIRGRLPAVVSAKGDRDMVSDIDVEIEHAVRSYLRGQNPAIGFLGEEEGRSSLGIIDLPSDGSPYSAGGGF